MKLQHKRTDATVSHMSQLDSLRSLAVLGVFITHFLHADDPIRWGLPWGWLGVRLFFVLSGFLITGILIACRQKIEDGSVSARKILRNFYLRRCLRLCPVYYLFLALALLIHPDLQSHLVAFVFYVQNFLFAAEPDTFNTLSHLWTLAVEAQFYLILPWLVLFLPKKRLIPTLLAMTIAAPIVRFTLLVWGLSTHQVNMMMPCHFDTLCLGGLLSALTASGIPGRRLAQKLLAIGFWVGTPLLLAYFVGRLLKVEDEILTVFAESGAGLFSVWLIGHASVGIKGFAGTVLNQKSLIYCGEISYGLYIFHFEIPKLFQNYTSLALGMTVDHGRIMFPIYTATAILVASVSWMWIEKPVNQLKRRFSLN